MLSYKRPCSKPQLSYPRQEHSPPPTVQCQLESEKRAKLNANFRRSLSSDFVAKFKFILANPQSPQQMAIQWSIRKRIMRKWKKVIIINREKNHNECKTETEKDRKRRQVIVTYLIYAISTIKIITNVTRQQKKRKTKLGKWKTHRQKERQSGRDLVHMQGAPSKKTFTEEREVVGGAHCWRTIKTIN